MKRPERHFNAKRALAEPPISEVETRRLEDLARRVRYGGNPQHKRDPGDFGLTPPAQGRAQKTLCDRAAVFRRKEALGLLRRGIRQGLVSQRVIGGWPKNVWAVARNGEPVEAILENETTGTYHGYAMGDDPLRGIVEDRWFGA